MSEESSDPVDRTRGSLLAILAEGFLSRLSFGIISFALPLYAYRKLGLSLTETGLLFSINLIAEQMFKPVMGWLADRVGVKRIFASAIALRSLVALLFAFSATPFQVFAIKFLHGFSESLRDPSVSVLIAENARRKSLAQAFGWYTSAKMSAGSMGKAIGGLLLAVFAENYSYVFFVAFALSILPLVVVALFVREPETHEVHAGQKQSESGGDTSGLVSAAILGFLIAGTAQMIANLFPILATEYGGLSDSQTSLIYAMSVVAIVTSGPLFGWLSDNVSRNLVLTVRGIANTVSSALFYFLPGFAGMAVGLTVDTMGKAAFRPAWGAIMAHYAALNPRRRARTMSYLSLGEGLGETIGPLLGGFIWNTWGVGALLATRVVMALIGEIYAIKTVKKVKSKK
ncbi:MAG: MFS transporter [Blastocatellales bacterium]